MAPQTAKRIKTLSITRPIIYGNTAKKIGDFRPPNAPAEHTHMWTIFVRGPQGEDISYFIKKVVFKLHETYPTPVRVVDSPPFELTETGWGEFEINVKIHFIDDANEKMLSFYHHLRLHPYTDKDQGGDGSGDEIKSVYYDEIVFNEPNELFFSKMIKKPGNLLPSNKTKDCVFSKQLEQEEIDRIKISTGKIDQEIEELKKKLENDLKKQ
ncbi:HCL452Cp [Eremothecium sinecaudum]|uniref:Protein AF-9 homolog n=1 Tax=Eremothecium sinecaudum TaxID=45286 RepID=A0A120K1S7_9SACH|nr:HCL452Cp [Eremothecium sinecaudum]AMD19699.1 HCL452Cp [Eremothecium sinecaudum]